MVPLRDFSGKLLLIKSDSISGRREGVSESDRIHIPV